MNVPGTVDRVLRLQGRARFIGAALIPISVGLGLSALWPVQGLLWWAVFALIVGVLGRLYSFISMGVIGGLIISELQDDEDDESTEGLAFEQIDLTIKDVGPVIGKFMDQEIHEWIEFADETNSNKAKYVGTVDDPSNTTNLPEYSIVMPGGIVYQFDIPQVDTA